MKMNPRAWFNRSRILMNTAENITFSANDPAGESSPRSELFSTAQMERYGQKLARFTFAERNKLGRFCRDDQRRGADIAS